MVRDNPIADLTRLAEEYINATEADCDVLPVGHETTCQCAAHLAVRERGRQLRQLIEEIRNA